jgi:hypothetical protein
VLLFVAVRLYSFLPLALPKTFSWILSAGVEMLYYTQLIIFIQVKGCLFMTGNKHNDVLTGRHQVVEKAADLILMPQLYPDSFF